MSRTRDIACGVLGLALASAYYAAADAIPKSLLADEVGADGVPKALALSLSLLSALLLLRAVRVRNAADDDETQQASALQHLRALGLVALGFAYIWATPHLGYLLGIALLISATALYYGSRPGLSLVLSASGGAVFLWAMFAKMLDVQMPAGIWAHLLG